MGDSEVSSIASTSGGEPLPKGFGWFVARGGKPRPRPAEEAAEVLGRVSFNSAPSGPLGTGGAARGLCRSFEEEVLSEEVGREFRPFSPEEDRDVRTGTAVAGLSGTSEAARALPPGGGGHCCPSCGSGALRAASRTSGETWVALDSERGARPLRATSAYDPFNMKEYLFFASL